MTASGRHYHDVQLSSSPRGDNNANCAGNRSISFIAFTTAVAALHQLNQDRPYHDHLTFAGITVVVTLGFCIGQDLDGIILKVLPWTVLVQDALQNLLTFALST